LSDAPGAGMTTPFLCVIHYSVLSIIIHHQPGAL
jgi:hypothetical protein